MVLRLVVACDRLNHLRHRVNTKETPFRGVTTREGDYDLTDSLAAQQFQVIVPDGWQQPDHFYQQVHGWTEGVTFTVHAPEDDDRESGAAVIHHYVVTLEADYLGDPEDWTEDPVYQYMQGASVRVTELDND